MQLIITEATRPKKESGPNCVNKSVISPIAAEEEIKRTKVSGANSAGNPNQSSNGRNKYVIQSNNPPARTTSTATNRPINVGRISTTVCKPSFAPSKNASYKFTRLKHPNTIIISTVTGIIKFDNHSRKFIFSLSLPAASPA